MLLGILFATSKQYSDKLSVDVKRGTDGNIKEGKYNGVVKKGYIVDTTTGWFEPDGYNWDLLREAVSMRLYQGKSNVEIAKFLNDSRLTVRKDQDEPHKVVKVDKQMVGDIFADPFYFGLYSYGNTLANLTDLHNFLPLMTPDEYIAINYDVAQDFGKSSVGHHKKNARLEYGLLRNKVICDYCDVTMQFQNQKIQRGKNKGKWMISFYCRNKECQRHKTEENKANRIKLSKSIRAKYVMAAIEWQLRHLTKKSEKAYRMYINGLETRLAQDKAIAKRKLLDAKIDLRKNEQKYMDYQTFQLEHPEEYAKHHPGKLELHQSLINAAEHSIKACEGELERLDTFTAYPRRILRTQ